MCGPLRTARENRPFGVAGRRRDRNLAPSRSEQTGQRRGPNSRGGCASKEARASQSLSLRQSLEEAAVSGLRPPGKCGQVYGILGARQAGSPERPQPLPTLARYRAHPSESLSSGRRRRTTANQHLAEGGRSGSHSGWPSTPRCARSTVPAGSGIDVFDRLERDLHRANKLVPRSRLAPTSGNSQRQSPPSCCTAKGADTRRTNSPSLAYSVPLGRKRQVPSG